MTAGRTYKPMAGGDSLQCDEPPEHAARPLQFRISALLVLTAVVAALFGLLRWVGVPPEAAAVVLVVLVAGAIAAVGLTAAVFMPFRGGGNGLDDRHEE